LHGYFFESIHGEVWPWIEPSERPEVSDDWKAHFFGSVEAAEAAAQADYDGDGFTNVEEYLTGTDPTVTDWQVKVQNNHVSFRWVGRAGKSYTVERTHDFKNWSAATGRIAGQDAFLEYNEIASGGRARFYRLNVQ
jgi:hypothetical protein